MPKSLNLFFYFISYIQMRWHKKNFSFTIYTYCIHLLFLLCVHIFAKESLGSVSQHCCYGVWESVSTFDVYCAVLPNTKKLSLPNKVFLMCHRRKDCWTIVSSAKEDFFLFIYYIFISFSVSVSLFIFLNLYICSFGNSQILVHRAIYITIEYTIFHPIFFLE
jgi:hypothetical protein